MLTDDKFVRRHHRGVKNEKRVAQILRDRGLQASLTERELRRRKSDIGQYRDEIDLIVNGLPVDVKSRTLAFTGPEDYPYPTAFVDTVGGWDAKALKPVAIILYSEPTEGTCVIRPSTSHEWTTRRAFDHDAEIWDDFYMADRESLTTLDEFVRWMERNR